MLPVASTKAWAVKMTNSPLGRQYPTAALTRPSESLRRRSTLTSMKTSMPTATARLLQGTDQLEPRPVAHVGQAGEPVSPEVALQDTTVRGPVEQCAPPLELVDPVGCLLGMDLGHAPVVEHLAAAHRVAEVHLPVVLGPDIAHGRGRATLGHNGVRLAQQGLADQRGPKAQLLRLDGGTQSGAAGADDNDVEVVGFVVGHGRVQKIFGSWKAPLATSRTYTSARATNTRLAHANCMCRAFSGVSVRHTR